ncbi:hypothetical protein Hanom_Chr00s000001g01592571 [Helianthus anomalus]
METIFKPKPCTRGNPARITPCHPLKLSLNRLFVKQSNNTTNSITPKHYKQISSTP